MIGDHVFECCKCLTRVKFQVGSRLQTIGFRCFANSGLEEFVAPSKLREIGPEAFWECTWLKRVTLNEGLEVMADKGKFGDIYGVFEHSGIKAITLPSTLKEIGRLAFSECPNLKTIYVKSGCQADLSELCMFTSVKIVRL